MESLIILTEGILQAQKFIDYFPRSYRHTDADGTVVVVPCSDPLAYAQEAAGMMGKTIRAYGIDKEGKKYSLLREKAS